MANQGNQGNQQQKPSDPNKPTGTSGRQSGNDVGDNRDVRRNDQTTGGSRRTPDEDEESGLGNRTTNR